MLKDDNSPYPSHAMFRSSIAGVKPYMSQPMLNSTSVKHNEPGYEQDSPPQSASPSGSVFRDSIGQRERSETNPVFRTHATFATAAARAQVTDELDLPLVQDESLVLTDNDHLKPRVRPLWPSRPAPDPPTVNHQHPSTFKSDAVGQTETLLSSQNDAAQSTVKPPVLPQTMASAKQEQPSIFSPAWFTRKASRPNLHDTFRKKSTDNLRNAPYASPLPSKHHRQSPSTVISNAHGLPTENLPPSSPLPAVKRPKPVNIDTSLSPVKNLTRKLSRPQLRQSHSKRTTEDPPMPYTHGQHGLNRLPSPPSPLPKNSVSMKTAAPLTSSSSIASQPSSYSTTASDPTPTESTTNTTPASATMNKVSSLPQHLPPPITTTVSTSAIPTSPPPPILQRSETAPHSYRLSLRLSGAFLRPPPLPLLNLPTLPPTTPSISSPPRFRLEDVPQLGRDGERKDPDEVEDDFDEDEEGRLSRTSGRATPFFDRDYEDGDGDEDGEGRGYRHTSSFSDSTGNFSISSASSSFNTSPGRETLSRSSYNHSPLSHSISIETSASVPFIHGTSSSSSSDFLALPELDLDLDLSFLDSEPSLSPAHDGSVLGSFKGKARARPENDDRHYVEEGGKTPTIGGSGGYLDVSKPVKYVLPVRKDSLKLRTGPDVLGGVIGKGKGKERERDDEIDTAKPRRPEVLQASVSLGPPSAGVGLGLALGGSGVYKSKRASRSLVDLGAAERREKVEEIVRDEEEKKMERRKSQLTYVAGSRSMEARARTPKLKIDTQLGQGKKSGGEAREREENVTGGLGKGTTKVLTQPLNLNGETGLATPKQASNKRLSRAPTFEAAVRRRRSLPVFSEATDPPPYPAFPPLSPSNLHNIAQLGFPGHNVNQAGLSIQPRDDEGRERLPPYSNLLHLRGILLRKMEFTSAGVQAKDRKWRRVVCVLEGTALKVYKPSRDLREKGVIGDWWERQVGVGDSRTSAGPAAKSKKDHEANGVGATTREQIPKLYGEGTDPAGQSDLELRPPPTPITPITPERTQPRLTGEHPFIPGQPPSSIYGSVQAQANRSRLNLAVSSLLKPTSYSRSRSHSRAKSDSANLNVYGNWNSSLNAAGTADSSFRPRHGHDGRGPPPFTIPGRPMAHAPSESSVRSRTSSATSAHAIDDPRDLLRVYTMQNAESGLGNDYRKRKNVIRVRAEGEQFLLQAKDLADVVAWIEVGSIFYSSLAFLLRPKVFVNIG